MPRVPGAAQHFFSGALRTRDRYRLGVWNGPGSSPGQVSNNKPLRRQPIHRLGELDVQLRHAAGVVGGERDLDLLVDVEPFRVMVELLGDQRRPGHEPEGLVEIAERELLGDGVAIFQLAPAYE